MEIYFTIHFMFLNRKHASSMKAVKVNYTYHILDTNITLSLITVAQTENIVYKLSFKIIYHSDFILLTAHPQAQNRLDINMYNGICIHHHIN